MSFEGRPKQQPIPEAPKNGEQAEQIVLFGNEKFTPYAAAVEHLISEIDQSPISEFHDKRDEVTPLRGSIGDTTYEVRLPTIPPNMGFVGIVELQKKGASFSCVVKRQQDSMRGVVERYGDAVNKNPAIKDFVPAPYARVGDWLVMERLYGIEGDEVKDRLAQDPDFMDLYVTATYRTTKELANQGLTLNDAMFVDGHNTMINPTNAEVKFIEFDNVQADRLHRQPHELITSLLLNELEQAYTTKRDEAFEYAFKLCGEALSDLAPGDLYIRPRVIAPTHPDFKRFYDLQQLNFGNWDKKLTPALHQELLDNAVEMTIPVDTQGYKTFAVSPDIIDCVLRNDKQKFIELLKAKKYLTKIDDVEDSRHEEVIMPG